MPSHRLTGVVLAAVVLGLSACGGEAGGAATRLAAGPETTAQASGASPSAGIASAPAVQAMPLAHLCVVNRSATPISLGGKEPPLTTGLSACRSGHMPPTDPWDIEGAVSTSSGTRLFTFAVSNPPNAGAPRVQINGRTSVPSFGAPFSMGFSFMCGSKNARGSVTVDLADDNMYGREWEFVVDAVDDCAS